MTRYAVIGAGAIGCYYGLKLLRNGNDVHFLFLGGEADIVRRDGLHLISPDGDYTATDVQAAGSWDELSQPDVALVAVKSLANEDVAARLPALLRGSGTVLLIQNGLGAEAVYRAQVGSGVTIVGGLAFIAAERRNVTEIHHFAHGNLTIAQDTPDESPAGITAIMTGIVADFAPGQHVDTAEDLLLARYQKLLWNTPFNALSVILNAQTDALMANPQSVALVKRVMQDVQTAAAAQGRTIDDSLIELLLETTRQLPPYSPSMKVDWDNGRPMEVEGIVHEPLRRADRFGVDVPALRTVYEELAFLEAGLESAAQPALPDPRTATLRPAAQPHGRA